MSKGVNIVKGVFALLMLLAGSVSGVSAKELSAKDLFRKASQSVVLIKVYGHDGKLFTLGSGVVVGYGVVASNCHVLTREGSDYAVVEWRNSKIRVGGDNMRGQDSERDLCTLDVPGLTAPAVKTVHSRDVDIGSKVYAIGAPEGYKLTLSEGLISGKRDFQGLRVLQTTAPISHGSSGGGLFDTQGRLVGITTLMDTAGQALNFAIPAEWIAELHAVDDAVLAAAYTAAAAADAAAAKVESSSPPRQDRWREIFYHEPSNRAYYKDTKSLIVSEGIISAWIKSTSGYGSSWAVSGKAISYHELFQRITFSCNTWEILITEEYITNKQGAQIGHRGKNGPFTVSPTSGYDPIITAMCSK